MPEFAVGYRKQRDKLKGWGAFAPLTEEQAREALKELIQKWPDAVLLTRDEPQRPWRMAKIDGRR